MPRDGSGVYTKPYPSVVSGTTIESLVYNGQVDDVTADLNTARPIVSGGTGADNAATGLFNLGGEKATQVVTSYDSHVWVPGSFRSAVGATGAPNATAIFSGVCYIHEAIANPPTNQNVTVEARDVSDGVLYIRTKTAGTWSAWRTERDTIDAAPLDALAYNGMQINGSMEVSQENGAGTITVSGPSKYIVDGWIAIATGAHNLLSGQSSTSPPGFANSLQAYATIANASPAAGDRGLLINVIEGYRISRLAFGTASAKSVTIGFWVYCSTTGLFSGSMRNGAENRSCVFTYTINAPLTWEYKTVTIPGDTAGTWVKTNALGAELTFTMLAGSTYLTATTGAWVAGNFIGATGTTNLLKNTTDYMMLTGVVVLPGIEAPTAAQSPLVMRPYDQELITCKRYWRRISPEGAGIANSSTTTVYFSLSHDGMRASPTVNQGAVTTITDVISANFTQGGPNASVASNDPNSGIYTLGGFVGLTSGRSYIYFSGPGIDLNVRL